MSKKTLFLRVIDEGKEKMVSFRREKTETGKFLKDNLNVSDSPDLGKDGRIARPFLSLKGKSCEFAALEIEKEGKTGLFEYVFTDPDPAIFAFVKAGNDTSEEENNHNRRKNDPKEDEEYKIAFVLRQNAFEPESLALPRQSDGGDWKNLDSREHKNGLSFNSAIKNVLTRPGQEGIPIIKTEKKQNELDGEYIFLTIGEAREKFISGEIRDPAFAVAYLRHLMDNFAEIFSEKEVFIKP